MFALNNVHEWKTFVSIFSMNIYVLLYLYYGIILCTILYHVTVEDRLQNVMEAPASVCSISGAVSGRSPVMYVAELLSQISICKHLCIPF